MARAELERTDPSLGRLRQAAERIVVARRATRSGLPLAAAAWCPLGHEYEAQYAGRPAIAH